MTNVLANVTSSKGILVVAPPTGTIPRKDWNQDRHHLVLELGRAGFQSIFDYDLLHPESRFVAIQRTIPRSFLIALKDRYHRANWYVNEAEVQVAMRTRTVNNGDEVSLFRYFDGAAKMALKFPSRLLENSWCKLYPDHEHCSFEHGFDPEVPNVPVTALEVKTSGFGQRAGRGVFARQRIPRGSMVGLEECVLGMYIPPSTYSLLDGIFFDKGTDWFDLWRGPLAYVYGYGWEDNEYVRITLAVVLSCLLSTSLTY
jgi:hypothetical protein